MNESPISIKDATCLMAVLENDIPKNERTRVAFLLLVLAGNPDLAKNYDVITDMKRQHYYDYAEYC